MILNWLHARVIDMAPAGPYTPAWEFKIKSRKLMTAMYDLDSVDFVHCSYMAETDMMEEVNFLLCRIL